MDARVRKIADVLVNYSVQVKEGEWVLIQSLPLGLDLVDACVSAVLKAGGHPTPVLFSEQLQETVLREGTEEQLSFIDPLTRTLVERVDVRIAIMAPSNTRTLAEIDPARLAIQGKAREVLMATSMRRTAEGTLRWTGTAYPTQAGAQDAGMSLRQYEEFVYGAALLNEPDPTAAWRALGKRQQRIADWLAEKSTIHVSGPGTDLTLGIAGRTWLNDDGHLNFPGGEIFTAPLENATQGYIQFAYPGYLQGREVGGVRLVFDAGKVIEASATSDESFLLNMLGMDDGARRLGEFAFGLNPGIQRFTKNTLFDEKIGGTLHMALGAAYPQSGGQNVSALHWDMVHDLRHGVEVNVDGQPFVRHGEIVI